MSCRLASVGLSLFVTLAACGTQDRVAEVPSVGAPPPASGVRSSDELDAAIGRLRADADARRWSPGLDAALSDPDARVRREAVLALGRLRDPSLAPRLLRALRDPDPSVRDAASYGVGALEARAPEGASAALLGVLVAETEPARRAHVLEDLGRLAEDEAIVPLEAALAASAPVERRGACRGVANLGARGRGAPADLLLSVARRLGGDEDGGVRLACAHALARVPDGAPFDATVGGLVLSATRDARGDVRAMAYRALAHSSVGDAAALAEGARDPDWTVAVQALRLLGRRTTNGDTATVLVRTVGALGDALLSTGEPAAGGPMHVYLTALEAVRPIARNPAVQAMLAAQFRRLGIVPSGHRFGRDQGLVHCAVAELVDLGANTVSNTEGCGLRFVNAEERAIRVAGLLAAHETPPAARVAELSRRFEEGAPRVREAIVAAAGTIELDAARSLVLGALATDASRGVRIAALEALGAFASRRASRRAAAVLAGTVAEDAWPASEVEAALRSSLEVFRGADDLEGLVSWVGTVGALSVDALTPEVERLVGHANLAVRDAARSLLLELGRTLPEVEIAAPSNPISPDEARPSAPTRVRVSTGRGAFVIELAVDDAPTTVARFLGLVRAHFYDGLTWHRVVPAFVVQGGDPEGDGYGGPGWSQRCEDQRLPYERGTVGMALAGRDTGGSQFFVTLAPQPHLDGRYTAFGRVIEGMEIVDRLQAGDAIERIEVVASTH